MGVIKSSVQAGFLAALSNILAQLLTLYRANKPLTALELTPIFNFVVYALANTPPNYAWQQFLEDSFPGTYDAPADKAESDEKARSVRKLHVTNTACKFVLDQTVGAALNTIAFVAVMAALKGLGTDEIVADVKAKFWPLMFAGYKLWPIISLLQFTVVPVQQRLVVGNLVGVGWGIFMSLFAAGK